jgi:hypothetical protein
LWLAIVATKGHLISLKQHYFIWLYSNELKLLSKWKEQHSDSEQLHLLTLLEFLPRFGFKEALVGSGFHLLEQLIRNRKRKNVLFNLLLPFIAVAQENKVTCDRACLGSYMDRYMDAMLDNNPSPELFSRDCKFTENGVRLPLSSEGLWLTMSDYAANALQGPSGALPQFPVTKLQIWHYRLPIHGFEQGRSSCGGSNASHTLRM